ncbi:MAG: tetratricopeptide repeat protein, partial [Spirochaetales bacterium]|nr:tetratricopeptide repeat protein [Spirochaetales bacterium]
WDDDRKVAAFITPADSALRNYASFIRQSCRDSTIPAYSEPMQFAVQVFHALGEIGCLYQVDPTLPFTEVQENLMVVDSISLPRNTLKNITGDCDDLTVLYCSLLETVGINTAFITIPGHIYAAFNTKVPARDFGKIHPDRKMTISIDGELWVPVEITMIGKTGFLEAWRTGVEEWTRYDNETSVRAFYKTRESQELYRPVGLTETDLGLQYGSSDAIDRDFNRDMDKIISGVVAEYVNTAATSGRKQDYNRLGIIYAQFQRYNQAETAFNKVISLDPEFTGARINLGNLQFLKENYKKAVTSYEIVIEKLEAKNRGESSTALKVLINLARASYMLEQFDEADSYFSKARNIDPEKTEEYSYLASAGDSGTGRAAEEPVMKESIIFVEE